MIKQFRLLSRFAILVTTCCFLSVRVDVHAQAPAVTVDTVNSVRVGTPLPAVGNRWLLIVCGLPGDVAHRERLTGAVLKIAKASKRVFGIEAEHLQTLVSDESMAQAVDKEIHSASVCTRESMENVFRELSTKVKPADSFMMILVGHAQYYNGRSTFNVQGRDFDAMELAKWMQPIQCRERIFWLTMPVSGFWIKPLSAPQTICITATEADLEFNGTEMPYALADVLDNQSGTQQLEDIDEDGHVSMMDLYLAVNIEIHNRFQSLKQLQTEHAQMDDNGDGKSKELQVPYLPAEVKEGESPKPIVKPDVKSSPTDNAEGDFARRVRIGKSLPTKSLP